MITGSLNLSGLKHVMMDKKGKSGMVKGIFIPLEANHLQENDKNSNVYFPLVAFEMKEAKDYATHIVKQSLPKEVREAMSQEEKNEMPILGNLKTSNGAPSEANNNASEETFVADGDDDLPF